MDEYSSFPLNARLDFQAKYAKYRSTDSIQKLEKAYPNYFARLKDFPDRAESYLLLERLISRCRKSGGNLPCPAAGEIAVGNFFCLVDFQGGDRSNLHFSLADTGKKCYISGVELRKTCR